MDHSPMAWFNRVIIFVVIVGVLVGGFFVYKSSVGEGKAKIRGMVPGGHVAGHFHCWLTLEFKEIPEGIDAENIEIVFSSIALEKDVVSFDWKYIADNALIKNPNGTGRLTTEEIKADKAPALNYPFDVNFNMDPRMSLEVTDSLRLRAELLWDGVLQDTRTASLEFLYGYTSE